MSVQIQAALTGTEQGEGDMEKGIGHGEGLEVVGTG